MTELKQKPPRELPGSRIQSSEFIRNIWCASPEDGTLFEEVCTERYWQMVKGDMKAGDQIEVMAEDGSWFAHLLVRVVKADGLTVGVLQHVDFGAASDPADFPGYKIRWGGRNRKHIVERVSDGHVLKEGVELKADAQMWLRDHLKNA